MVFAGPRVEVASRWPPWPPSARPSGSGRRPRWSRSPGSNGKTTTKDLLAAALGARLTTVANQASFNNEVGP